MWDQGKPCKNNVSSRDKYQRPYATGRHELEDGKNDVVITNSDVVSALAYRPVAVEDVKQAVLTSGRNIYLYICRKQLMLFRQNQL